MHLPGSSRFPTVAGALALGLLAVLAGCEERAASSLSNRPPEMVGKVYYLDGAGNYGFGTSSVPLGLKKAGYKGDFEVYLWTVSFMPLIDQRAGALLRGRGADLAKKIDSYAREYPGRPINLIGLSAGNGVLIYALEALDPDVKVDNVVMLGCSMSYDYDLTRALEHVRNKVQIYYSQGDGMLGGVVAAVGTVDGKVATKCMGQVGAVPPDDAGEQTRQLYADHIVNNPWMSSYRRYGYGGDHTSATSTAFVQVVIAPEILDMHGPTVRFANERQAADTSPR